MFVKRKVSTFCYYGDLIRLKKFVTIIVKISHWLIVKVVYKISDWMKICVITPWSVNPSIPSSGYLDILTAVSMALATRRNTFHIIFSAWTSFCWTISSAVATDEFKSNLIQRWNWFIPPTVRDIPTIHRWVPWHALQFDPVMKLQVSPQWMLSCSSISWRETLWSQYPNFWLLIESVESLFRQWGSSTVVNELKHGNACTRYFVNCTVFVIEHIEKIV